MKNTFCIATLIAIMQANSAFAATGAEGSGFSLIGWIFLGFLAVIITLQFVPALIMFGSMMMGIFGKAKSHGRETADKAGNA
ncbi:MAG: hypothetical protein KAI69_03390 [Deltaproteobacteria bacterium]|nr:hypothetical protein [Deltaproteobacteria bacterium]